MTQNQASRVQPTAIISYAHESDAHARLVRTTLADRLRRDGVDCDLDQYVVVPEGGWPQWMTAHIADSKRFVLVVCSPKYLRRWLLAEERGVGLGAKWESKLIREVLYEAEGFNHRVIPVVLTPADVAHIPLELRDTTYYDLSSAQDYLKLLARLTGQPLVSAPPVEQPVRLLPEQSQSIASMFYILQAVKGDLQIEVVAAALGMEASAVEELLAPFVAEGFIQRNGPGTLATRYSHPVMPVPTAGTELRSSVLTLWLAHIDCHRSEPLTLDHITDVLGLATLRNLRPEAVARVFPVLDKHLKRHGDKQLVWDAAEISLNAARRDGRSEDDARAEAVSLICGRSWVLQRVGRLDEAQNDALTSLKLGENLHWHRNTAFCRKCLGRLNRMQAETDLEAGRRSQHLADSEHSLLEAIQLFTKLGDHDSSAEIGECYSLFARTLLVAGRLDEMDEALRQADTRLHDEGSKAYLDYLILRGDAARARHQYAAAHGFYSDVVARGDQGDAQRSEIVARAYYARGRNRHEGAAAARRDLEASVRIWRILKDPLENMAQWALYEHDRVVPTNEAANNLLSKEDFATRVRALQIHQERIAVRRKTVRARRTGTEPGVAYWEQVIQEARREVAIQQHTWSS